MPTRRRRTKKRRGGRQLSPAEMGSISKSFNKTISEANKAAGHVASAKKKVDALYQKSKNIPQLNTGRLASLRSKFGTAAKGLRSKSSPTFQKVKSTQAALRAATVGGGRHKSRRRRKSRRRGSKRRKSRRRKSRRRGSRKRRRSRRR